ncbi:hypothetical protein LDENG_00071630 [Lucifuga dentata]|nr:hypothetical protein LDENG_00071630 [Lucifuga dentata]
MISALKSCFSCRQFINGTCRFGTRCHFLHEWPVIPSAQICRYFQKGGCWYGERCRFLHVPLPDSDAAVAGRRSSVPNVSSSSPHVSYALPDRRGSEPAVLQAQVTSSQECIRPEAVLVNGSDPQCHTECLTTDNSEEGSQDANSSLTASSESAQSSENAEAGASSGRNQQEISPRETTKDAGAAAASTGLENIDATEAFLQSKDIICGICMDKVYEKADPSEQVFGILPNCNHTFCLKCIITWRKTKDLQPEVIKSCPQCRVKSAFYVANKYWVEGKAKETVIAAFKEKCR